MIGSWTPTKRRADQHNDCLPPHVCPVGGEVVVEGPVELLRVMSPVLLTRLGEGVEAAMPVETCRRSTRIHMRRSPPPIAVANSRHICPYSFQCLSWHVFRHHCAGIELLG
jgi:hypothetical protein